MVDNKKFNRQMPAYKLICPAMLVIFALNIYPLLNTFVISFQWKNMLDASKNGFAGLEQYISVLTNSEFWNSVKVTGQFVIMSLTIQSVFGMLIALLLNQNFKGRRFVRGAILAPWAVPTLVNAVLWGWMLNANYGLINRLLMQWGRISEPVAWLGDAKIAMIMIVLADTWRMLPLTVLMFLSGLQSVSAVSLEAGKIDGANVFQRFFHIILPQMKPIILVVLIMRTTQTMKVFDIVYMLTNGGPANGTMVISFYTYYTTFKSLNFGLGATLSIVIAGIIFLITLLYLRILKEA
ncbi:ABC transporter permease subunit [Lactonifactor sp. BIOML-A3]|nr:ABC transporter permease subunit [Lactonifactor sp. BIOML-A5]MSA10619.1 ABC transporter permease subunit [Lactonifactor sp. BIOML-A4]MSA15126.1 ABC transporter permease subunit [Lactonifactor sp. BIOML-A3]MSA19556.1 ABC transporter permease subunit [Lactonifactor sp. BIOML-A2]MSA40193.1 ABC transporter permease subunit [Lactonifactor sp. BIOML-A1]MSB16014.1 ABC transporter permease subunit [Lactonifactor sp. BIOML-A6]MSB71511.1 ABC transporter permease subunit [Lactonifactor sp. BIOML-A7]